jgi:spore germination protein YaaH
MKKFKKLILFSTLIIPLLFSSFLLKNLTIFAASNKSTSVSNGKKAASPTPSPTPTPTPVPSSTPAPSSTSKKVLGYTTYYYNGDVSSYNSLTSNYSSVDEITTHTYIMDKLGNISGIVPQAQVEFANNNGIKTFAMVSNNFSGEIAKAVLENAATRNTLISNITSALQANNYKGVNIDMEGVYSTNRNQLTDFMKELYSTLKPLGYSVAISVPGKTYDNPSLSWSGAYDYVELAKSSDEVILMTYDEHYPRGTPGPVASIGWVQNVLNYAMTTMPREKILLGVAAYGYDWSSNGTKAFSISQAMSTANKYGAEIKWDDVSQTPYYNYTDENGVYHDVWFENSYSLAFKLNLVNAQNISGIAIWRLGLEDAAYWQTINSKLN